MKEFNLIKTFFTEQKVKREDVVLGIGDDCALVQPSERQHIAITTDTLVAGVHFPLNTSPRAIGHKSIAVNLSDLAAMGAEPTWISLAITLPEVDETWLSEFSAGIFPLCEQYNVQLIGGDTTQGPLSVTITAQGFVPYKKHLSRSGASSGDWLYVTGELGDAALALQHIQHKITLSDDMQTLVQKKLDYPYPRVLAGSILRNYASSAIDISDGVLADLSHVCKASGVGATIELNNLPLSDTMRNAVNSTKSSQLALNGGDDYELLFTVNNSNKVAMESALSGIDCKVTCIGQMNPSKKISTTINGTEIDVDSDGFEHFST
jgi:thiamine-monophosphate kinase